MTVAVYGTGDGHPDITPYSACIMSERVGLGVWKPTGESIHTAQLPDARELRSGWVPVAESAGLCLGKPFYGRVLSIRDDDRGPWRDLNRRQLYAMVPVADVVAACAALVESIAVRHGAGRVWFCGEPCYLVKRSEAARGEVPLRAMGYLRSDLDADLDAEIEPGSAADEFVSTAEACDRDERRILMGCYYFHEKAA